MRLSLRTAVQQPVDSVVAGFDESLFRALSPPFPRVKLRRFDGSETGDVVDLELNFGLFCQRWTSTITHHERGSDYYEFVDEGTTLPFFLGYWRHHHRIERTCSGSCIVDNIEYQAPRRWLSPLLYPVLFLQFWYRKPIYRRKFGKP